MFWNNSAVKHGMYFITKNTVYVSTLTWIKMKMCQFVELISHKVISKNLISCIFFIQHWFSFPLKFFHCAAWLISCFAETTIKAIKSKTSWNCGLIFMVSVLSSHILHQGIYPRVVLIPNTTCLYTHKTGFTMSSLEINILSETTWQYL